VNSPRCITTSVGQTNSIGGGARACSFSCVTSSNGHGADSGPSKKPRRAYSSCEQIRTEAPAFLLLTTDSLRQTAPSARHAEPPTWRHHGDQGSDLAVESIVSLRHTVTPRPPFRTSKACPTSIHSLILAPFLKVDSTARILCVSKLIDMKSAIFGQDLRDSRWNRYAAFSLTNHHPGGARDQDPPMTESFPQKMRWRGLWSARASSQQEF
jgi:hypothetical protein